MKAQTFALVASALGFVACMPEYREASFAQLAPIPKRTQTKSYANIVLVPDGGKPSCDAVFVGRVTGRGRSERGIDRDADAILAVREELAVRGLDGAADFVCAAPGTYDVGKCAGMAFYCRN